MPGEAALAARIRHFDASNLHGQTISIDAAYVNSRLAELSRNEDLSRFIL